MGDCLARDDRRERVAEVVHRCRRTFVAKIDVPIVDPAPIQEPAPGVDGGFRRDGGAGKFGERLFRIVKRLHDAAIGERRQMLADRTRLV